MNNIRNLFLIDRGASFAQYILNQTSWNISCLVVEKCASKIVRDNSRIKNIVFYDDLLNIQHVGNINIPLLEKMRDIQLDCETTMHRCFHDNILSKYIFYSHLSFFEEVFGSNQIDILLCGETNLGVPSVTIPLGLSKLYKIPAYTVDHDSFFSIIYNYNLERYVVASKNSNIAIDKKMYVNYSFQSRVHYPYFKKKIFNIMQNFGGQLLIEFFVCLINFNFYHYERLGIHFNYWNKLKSYINLKKALRFYERNAITPNLNARFIYFSLHLEPEAVILARVALDNQLLLIKMLSKALPKGWLIYVKEHPNQSRINNQACSYLINNVDYFKSVNFYKELSKIDNVRLIKINTPSKELMLNAQAVASIGGSISIEAWKHQKIAINFCPKQSFSSFLSNSFGVEQYSDLTKIMSLLECNRRGFEKKIDIENDRKKMEKFLIPKSSSAFSIILDTILKDIEDNPCK